MESLLVSLPVMLDTRAESGRTLVASRDIEAGELIFSSAPLGFFIRRNHASRFCACCMRFVAADDEPLPCRCLGCKRTYYCSEECKFACEERHALVCGAINLIDVAKKKQSAEICNLAFLTLSVLETCVSLPQVPLGPLCAAGTVSSKSVDTDAKIAKPSLSHLLGLMSDTEGSREFPRRAKQRQAAASAVLDAVKADSSKLVALLRNTDDGIELTHGLLEDAMSAGPLNQFGVWGEDGEECGKANYPAAALINHSCMPTVRMRQEGPLQCVYALQPIRMGQELLQTYVSLGPTASLRDAGYSSCLKNSTASSSTPEFCARGERNNAIREQWGFTCACMRCALEARGFLGPGGRVPTDDVVADQIETVENFERTLQCECGGVRIRFDDVQAQLTSLRQDQTLPDRADMGYSDHGVHACARPQTRSEHCDCLPNLIRAC